MSTTNRTINVNLHDAKPMQGYPHIVISGAFGFGNLGDDAILISELELLLHHLPTASFTIFGGKNLLPLLSSSTLSQSLISLVYARRVWTFRMLKEIFRCNCFISGGGGLMQDDQPFTIPFYFGLLSLAKLLGKKTVVLSQGSGILKHTLIRHLTRSILQKTNLVMVRDAYSKQNLEQLGIKREIYLTADPAMTLAPLDATEKFLRENIPQHQPLIGIALRERKETTIFKDQTIECCRILAQRGFTIVYVPMARHEGDHEIFNELAAKIPQKTIYLLKGHYWPQELLDIFSRFTLTLSMRLHACIFSALNFVPVIGLVCDPKIHSFLKQIGLGEYAVTFPELSKDNDALKKRVQKAITSQNTIRETMKKNITHLQQRAEQAGILVKNLLL